MLHPLQAGLRLVSTRPAFCDKRKGEEEEYGWDFVKKKDYDPNTTLIFVSGKSVQPIGRN